MTLIASKSLYITSCGGPSHMNTSNECPQPDWKILEGDEVTIGKDKQGSTVFHIKGPVEDDTESY